MVLWPRLLWVYILPKRAVFNAIFRLKMVLRTSPLAPLLPFLLKRVMTSLKPTPLPPSPSLSLLLRRRRHPRRRSPFPRRSLSLQQLLLLVPLVNRSLALVTPKHPPPRLPSTLVRATGPSFSLALLLGRSHWRMVSLWQRSRVLDPMAGSLRWVSLCFFLEWLTNSNDQADVKNYKPSAAAASTSAAGKPAAVPADYEDIPTSNMRRTIGKRLTESKQQLPHYYVTVEVNMGEFKSYMRLEQC